MGIELYFVFVGLLGLSARIPQIVKLVKRKTSSDISVWYWGILSFCFLSWVWYGVYKQSVSIVMSNVLALVLNIIVLVLVIKYKEKKNE